MLNQLGFSPLVVDLSEPLRELLSTKKAWVYSQETAFDHIEEELTKPVVLALYNHLAKMKIRSDVSAYGLGTVLQKYSYDWKAVAYASRALTETESRYS